MDGTHPDICPACRKAFDSAKRRKLIDSCGHERCFTCVFKGQACPACLRPGNRHTHAATRLLKDGPVNIGNRARLKKDNSDVPELPPRQRRIVSPLASPVAPPVPARPNHLQPLTGVPQYNQNYSPNQYKNYSHLISSQDHPSSRFSVSTADLDPDCESPPPPPPDVAQNDLMMRLGLLLGDRISPSGITGVGISLLESHHGETSLNSPPLSSVSGIINSPLSSVSKIIDHTPERSMSDISPMSTLTASSGGDLDMVGRGLNSAQSASLRLTDMRIQNTESWNSFRSPGSINTNITPQRPHSITTSVPGTIEDLPMFGGERNSSIRRSAKASINGDRSYRSPQEASINGDRSYRSPQEVNYKATKAPQLEMKPQIFEVPHPQGKPLFVGRAWLFNELKTVLCGEKSEHSKVNGVIIVGDSGTGKTAIVEQLVNHSCFADMNATSTVELPSLGVQDSTKQADQATLDDLGSRVVAYQFCQADNSPTCMVADMICNMAAQLIKVPQLLAYRDLLLQDSQLQNLLSINECVQNPSLSFIKGILEPLQRLKNSGNILIDGCCIILIDSLNEAEFHRPDYGDTIASFLCRHANRFPPWLKLVLTVQSRLEDITSSLAYHRIYLDPHRNQIDHVYRDITDYINHRLSLSSHIRTNISINGRLDKALQSKFTSHVQVLSKGSFLYVKSVLDLIECGHLVPKSSNYTLLPVNLSEVFLLHFNLRFSSLVAFERVSTVLSVCLASLYPLTLADIFLTVNSGYTQQYLSWEDFCQRVDVLTGFLHRRHDDTYMFFHPAFRDWLICRQETDSLKFLCDVRNGHALLAFRLSRVSAPLPADKTAELGHHILKAHIYKTVSRQLGYSSRDMQAFWMCLSSRSLDAALVSHRNVFSPNIKVSRLILLSGSSANVRTTHLNNSPLLSVVAREGFVDMVSLLIEFGADVNAASDTGMTPLCHAASAGQTEVTKMLYLRNARLSATDNQGQCAAIHAVIHGQHDTLRYLLQLNWPVIPGELNKDEVITQCFVMSAITGNIQILDYLLTTFTGSRLNKVDSLMSETALTASCLHGKFDVVQKLLKTGTDVAVLNGRSLTPLQCAVKCGHWEICHVLLAAGAALETPDKHGRTPLMVAAGEGHLSVVKLLQENGADLQTKDNDGLTALGWACVQGHILVVESLIHAGSNVNQSDNISRTPLHLATFSGDANIVHLLMEHGADIEHADVNGMRALDYAISCRNLPVIVCFLRKGAKLGPDTWAMAAGKTDVLLLLLNKLMDDGNILYKKSRIKEASLRFQYALKKFPRENNLEEEQIFKELRLNFLLNLSRCKRRMNELQSAIDWATKALGIRPECFEAFYARARARRDARQYSAALEDLMEALTLAPKNQELQRLLTRVQEECREQLARLERGGGTDPGMSSSPDGRDASLQLGQYIPGGVAL